MDLRSVMGKGCLLMYVGPFFFTLFIYFVCGPFARRRGDGDLISCFRWHSIGFSDMAIERRANKKPNKQIDIQRARKRFAKAKGYSARSPIENMIRVPFSRLEHPI